jgi:hypothetical protein
VDAGELHEESLALSRQGQETAKKNLFVFLVLLAFLAILGGFARNSFYEHSLAFLFWVVWVYSEVSKGGAYR